LSRCGGISSAALNLSSSDVDATRVKLVKEAVCPAHDGAGAAVSTPQSESLAEIRDESRRERLLDMQLRLRPYRAATFAILAVAFASVSSQFGWWWIAPFAIGAASAPIADHFVQRSQHPGLWIAASWGILPLLLGDAVVLTGGAESPALMLFSLPAVTLGSRYSPRGMALGTAYILSLLLVATYGFDATVAAENYEYVVSAVALVVCTVILSGALVESDRAHRHRSTLDPLTGLFNRNALEQRLGELDADLVAEGRDGLSHSLLLCDLDHFKRVNDQLGHAAGDAVLQDVAYTMRAALRAGDSIYRVGGEEILVVLPGAGKRDAIDIAERLRNAVRDRRPAGVPVTISIGVAVSRSAEVGTDGLVSRADSALYKAKTEGRDRVSVGA
jgi:diguanylate cyclase (GGDEF)-like protein